MNVPIFSDVKYVDEDGSLTPSMAMYHDELNQTLRDNLSDNGWKLPTLTDTDITKIDPQMPDGTIWYDTVNSVLVAKINGTLVKLETAAYP